MEQSLPMVYCFFSYIHSLYFRTNRKWKILDAFDDVFISSEIGLVKPDPRIYIYVAEKMGIEPGQAVFIDDFKENVDSALKVGFHGVHFQNPAQAIQDVRKVLEEHS